MSFPVKRGSNAQVADLRRRPANGRFFVVALLMVAAIPTSAMAMTNGSVDTDDDYPFVGLLAFYTAEGEYSHRCTGTLISDTVVVTAAHCTDGTATAYAYFVSPVPNDFRVNPTGLSGVTHTHPAYNPLTIDNDVGVVLLDAPASVWDGDYPTLPGAGLLSELKAAHEIQDDTFVAVGYGLNDGFPSPNLAEDLLRRFAVSPYRGLNKNNLHLFQNPNVGDAGGTCFGDSGGPHFLNETLLLVAVTSWGDAICRANDMTQRLDLQPVSNSSRVSTRTESRSPARSTAATETAAFRLSMGGVRNAQLPVVVRGTSKRARSAGARWARRRSGDDHRVATSALLGARDHRILPG